MPRLLVYAGSIAWQGILITESQTLVEFDVCLDERFCLQPFLFKVSLFDKCERRGRNVCLRMYVKYVNIYKKKEKDVLTIANSSFVKRIRVLNEDDEIKCIKGCGVNYGRFPS